MNPHRNSVLLAIVCLLVGTSAFAKNLPNVDALFLSKTKPNNSASVAQKVGGLKRPGLPIQAEERLGVPTFVWLDPTELSGTRPIGNGAERAEIAAARGILNGAGNAYGLHRDDVTGASVEGVISTGRGPVIVKFSQQVDGIPIFREELNVVMDQRLNPVAISGYISSQATTVLGEFSRSEAVAAVDALKNLTDIGLSASQLTPAGTRDGHDFFTVKSSTGVELADPVRMRKVYFHLPDGLVPAYYIETSVMVRDGVSSEGVFAGNITTDSYSYVISAIDGSILFRKNLTEDAGGAPQQNALPPGGFTYRVWADPVTGIPYDTPAGNGVHPKLAPVPDGAQHSFVPQVDVTLPNFPFSQNDPWLAPGATQTVGNNADAYLDLFGLVDANGNPSTNDGLAPIAPPADPPTGDFRADITAPGAFLHNNVPDTISASAQARQGAIQQLFYNINFLHDWYYDAGFTESMRNAQTNNFGRGGLGNDNIRSEVQDYSGYNNANMSTPSDGARPRMQMFNFPNKANHTEILSPAGIAGLRSMGVTMSSVQTFDVNAEVLMATFDGSNTVTNAAALAGKIAMFDFNNSFSTRITNLNATGVAGILMVWQSGQSANSVVNITGFNTVWSKPIATISFNSAAPIKTQLAVPNTVTLRMRRFADRDGTLDNQIVFHEWGHYLSNRLVANSAGLSNNQGRAMGEGWGDFTAMMLTVRENDTLTPSNANWGGVYAIATYATSGVPFSGAANHGYYLGIRRTPYSTDMANYNAFTFKHIMNGVALPTGPPVATSGQPNSQVHNSGEVWANMLWECYASLLRDTQGATPRLTFQMAQDRMKSYLVASLALTPPAPTYVEARDAVLAAAYATDYTDYLNFWAAFAKRGMGVGAVAPDRASTTHAGVVESFAVAPDVMVVNSATLLDDSVASCDGDGSLDAGEYGKLTVAIKNVGSTALTSTTATIGSTTPGVTFPNGTTINFPASDPLSTVSAQITVALDPSVTGIQQINFQIVVSDPGVSGSRNGTASFRGNTDIVPASSATDNVEGSTMSTTPWTLEHDPVLGNIAPFSIETVTPLSRRWFGPNGGAPSDNRLVSPVFTLGLEGGNVTMEFDHTWSFENLYDGGVIEMSVNGGPWSDVGVNGGGTSGCYNATPLLIAGGTNPLNGRPAFTGTQSASQHCTISRLLEPFDTVRFRFRTGADDNTAGTGWRIDNITFSGVTETPFPTVVGDTACVTPSSTALTTSANPSPLGSSLTLTATVTSAGGTPTGNVTFNDGATPLGTVALSGGVATLSTSSLTVGLHSLTASYAGDATHLPSSSPSVSQTISKIASSVSVISSVNPSAAGQSVTFTATVSATSGTPGGSVTFKDGASTLATVALVGGTASHTTSALTGGAHNISAVYGGNGTYFGSTGSVTQYVNPPTYNFAPVTYYVVENAGTVTLTITRSGGDPSGAGSVLVSTTDGTAAAGVRYTTTNTSVEFESGQTTKTVSIPVINTSAIEGMQNFTAAIASPTGGVVGPNVTATINVVDDDTINSDFTSPSDGKRDIVWRNATTGDTRVWEMNNTLPLAPTSFTSLENRGAPWVLSGIADFNADGKADVLWRSSVTNLMEVWYMNGTVRTGSASVPSSPDPNWRVAATGDFNGDGFADIVWRHATTYAASLWLMRDTTLLSTSALPTVPDANWNIMGVGDFNRDKKLDIVWRNSMSKGCAVWLMNGTTFLNAVILPSVGAPWNLVGIGDMNGDGDADMIWQTTTTRQVAIWRMNQTSFVSGHFIDTSADLATANDPNYSIVGPK